MEPFELSDEYKDNPTLETVVANANNVNGCREGHRDIIMEIINTLSNLDLRNKIILNSHIRLQYIEDPEPPEVVADRHLQKIANGTDGEEVYVDVDQLQAIHQSVNGFIKYIEKCCEEGWKYQQDWDIVVRVAYNLACVTYGTAEVQEILTIENSEVSDYVMTLSDFNMLLDSLKIPYKVSRVGMPNNYQYRLFALEKEEVGLRMADHKQLIHYLQTVCTDAIPKLNHGEIKEVERTILTYLCDKYGIKLIANILNMLPEQLVNFYKVRMDDVNKLLESFSIPFRLEYHLSQSDSWFIVKYTGG